MAKEKALSQQEIDTLLEQANSSAMEPALATLTPVPSSRKGVYRVSADPLLEEAAAPAQESFTGMEVLEHAFRAFRTDMDNLVKRMERLEALVEDVNTIQAQSIQLPPEIQNASGLLQGLEGKVGQIEEKLRTSLGIGVRDTFKCTHCGTTGLVAIHLRCTKCSHETWWGWWAPRGRKQ